MFFFYGYIHSVIWSLNTKCQFNHQFFISLAVLGLTCSMQDLPSLLQHIRSLAVACGIQFPDQGLNPGPLHWELGVLVTGPPEKSQQHFKVLLSLSRLTSGRSALLRVWRISLQTFSLYSYACICTSEHTRLSLYTHQFKK